MEQKYVLLNEGEVIKWQGLWSAEKEIYAIGDVVKHAKTGYGTCTYKAIVGHVPTAATEPEVGASWETVWDEFLMGGQNGTGEGTGDVISSGKSGGQTVNGGTGEGEDLTLESTAHTTKGDVLIQGGGGNTGIGTTSPEGILEVEGSGTGWGGGIVVSESTKCEKWGIIAGTEKSLWFLPKSGGGGSVSIPYNGGMTVEGIISSDGLSLTGPVKRSILSKTANYVITDTDPDVVVMGVISAHATITLPTAADNVGRIITVIIGGEPGAYNVVVDGEGAETINGAATKTNSDRYSYLRLLSTGSVWLIIGSAGTWT